MKRYFENCNTKQSEDVEVYTVDVDSIPRSKMPNFFLKQWKLKQRKNKQLEKKKLNGESKSLRAQKKNEMHTGKKMDRRESRSLRAQKKNEMHTGKKMDRRESRSLRAQKKNEMHTGRGKLQKKLREIDHLDPEDLRMTDPFPGDAPIPKERIMKYERGTKMKSFDARTKFASIKFEAQEKKLQLAAKQAARSEFLLQEESGYLEAEEGEHTTDVTQHDLAKTVDITSAQKYFELTLKEFGPYYMDYTRNGRFLLIGGRRGHVAAIEWQTKKLLCEINVMETIRDVKWLHQETMYAVAQKKWTCIYDNQGIELHCLKTLDSVLNLEFLPYHFLLAGANEKGYLSYLDISIGQKVAAHSTGLGRLDVMCHNPHNAVVCLGHPAGVVTMWSPNLKKPLVKMLCHGGTVRSLAVDQRGNYMATSGVDRTMKIWDLRTFKMLQSYKIGAGAGNLAFSQRELLAVGKENIVEVYKDCCRQTVTSPYMCHRFQRTSICDLQFCPYEDVIGIGHGEGFTSLLIPGAGEANFDALEANPYQNKTQRKQAEVKMLLEKIPHDMISMDTAAVGHVDIKSLQEEMEEKKKLLYLKPQDLEFEPKYKMKGRSKGKKKIERKKGVIGSMKKEIIRKQVAFKQENNRNQKFEKNRSKKSSVLDRFKRKED